MHSLPFSRSLALVVATLASILVVGCSTGNGDAEEPTETPAAEPAPREKTPSEPADKPEFEADFEGADGGDGGAPSTEDPAPPDGDQCIDNDDPGSAENVAKALPPTDDCDDKYKTVSGVANGAVDVDFYKLSATDKFGCSVEADFEGQTAGTEICVFARCKNSTTDAVKGCEQGVMTTSSIGMKGCCAAAPARALPDWDCSGVTDNDSADFFIRVKQINADKCLPYKLRYRF